MEQFVWKPQPLAESLIKKEYDVIKGRHEKVSELETFFYEKTSTRLFDWLSHLTVPYEKKLEDELEQVGFSREIRTESYVLYHHPEAQFPRILLCFNGSFGLSILAESVANYFMANCIDNPIEGTILGAFRKGVFFEEGDFFLACVERRGTRSVEPTHESKEQILYYLLAEQMWKTRPRAMSDEGKMMRITMELAKVMVDMVGTARAASIVLDVEREFWETKNFAAQIQKARQDQLGLGWANHDHHTFRSSRRFFKPLIELFELLGFYCRERFYAGLEAGWGAQVMENPQIQSVLFLDVDLDPEEVAIDFAHMELNEKDHLGTVGLWCGLHGESIFQAGMHHLEAQFNHQKLTEDLQKFSVPMMEPFSKFDYLKQAFTKGERWKVPPGRLQALYEKKLITKELQEKFLKEGAIGSHLENLERNEGFKGFNQKNVSFIIHKTDPRENL